MDCRYPSDSVAARLLSGLPKSRREFAGVNTACCIHHQVYIETGARLLTSWWVATTVSFCGGRQPSPDTNHSSVSGTEGSHWRNACVRKSRHVEGCSACPVCDDGLWRWEYLRVTLWGSYSFLLFFCSSPSFYFLIFIFISYSISCFILFSYFSHSYYFISYLRRSVSFRSPFVLYSHVSAGAWSWPPILKQYRG